MKVKIRGNITYEQKSIGFFTTAQLIYTVIGTLTAIGIYNLIHNVLPVVFSTLLATAVFIVIAALGFLNLGGMKATEVIRRIFKIALGNVIMPSSNVTFFNPVNANTP